MVAYDGAAYQGFQRQRSGVPSIQGVLEAALQAVIGVPTVLRGAARTDTGVHASGQVITFRADWKHDTTALVRALNSRLPADIAIQRLSSAPDGFHPRFDAISRTYRYQVIEGAPRHPLFDRQGWQVRKPLDLDAMQQAAALIPGEHDFAAFGRPTQGEITIRRVYRSMWFAEPLSESIHGLSGRLLSYWVEANGFLKHMVRVLVGGMVEVGLGWLTCDSLAAILHSVDRDQAKFSAPPHGLTLMAVSYPATMTLPGVLDRPPFRSDRSDILPIPTTSHATVTDLTERDEDDKEARRL